MKINLSSVASASVSMTTFKVLVVSQQNVPYADKVMKLILAKICCLILIERKENPSSKKFDAVPIAEKRDIV